jgi:MFS family permease
MSQFLFQTPAGYLYDYTESKVLWLSIAAIATTALTVFTAAFAQPYGANLSLMIFVKFLQGAVTSFIPPGLNSITQGIVGVSGMTSQVSTNEMMNHLGTAIIVLTGSIVGVILYPDLGFLFIVSPIACIGFLLFLNRIKLSDIDHAEARGLTTNKKTDSNQTPPTTEAYNPPNESKKVQDQPSFNFGWKNGDNSTITQSLAEPRAESPLRVLRDPILLTLYVS